MVSALLTDRNRIMRSGAARRALLLAFVCLLGAFALAGCGGGEDTGSSGVDTAELEQEADAESLNEIISRQQGAVLAYAAALVPLRGEARELAETFRAQEQEHVDGTILALRGLGGEEEAEPEEIEAGAPIESREDALHFLYELESATIEAELTAIGSLESSEGRTVLAATVANQAQHLVELRRLLGLRPPATIPEAFESGVAPAP
jgi:Ferritin-like domain